MAFHRGIQSAIFWYLSCAPCAEAGHRKRRKAEAERGRQERELLAVQIPNMYRHPSPASTNPHWHTEVEAGPHLVSVSQKQRNAANLKRSGTVTSSNNGSGKPSSIDVSSTSGSRDGRNDSKFDFRQYQRDDDVLWGAPNGSLSMGMEGSGSQASWQDGALVVTRPQRALTRGSDVSSTHASFRNPQINDLHPATVTKIQSRDEARWMFQPLPTGDVMSGKMRVPRSRSDSAPRSRSDSGASTQFSGRSAVPLSREVSHRLVEQKLKNGEDPLAATIEDKDFAQPATTLSPTPDIDLNRPKANSVASPLHGSIRLPESEDSNESSSTTLHRPDLAPEPLRNVQTQTRKVASRPQLSTIFSENSAAPSDSENSAPSTAHHSENSIIKENHDLDRANRHSAFIASNNHDDSLKVIRDLAPQSKIFKTQLVSTDDLRQHRSPHRKKKSSSSRLPSQDTTTTERFDFDPDLFEHWVHEHTKREVSERWSMDF